MIGVISLFGGITGSSGDFFLPLQQLRGLVSVTDVSGIMMQ
jgi:hypothetical protein